MRGSGADDHTLSVHSRPVTGITPSDRSPGGQATSPERLERRNAHALDLRRHAVSAVLAVLLAVAGLFAAHALAAAAPARAAVWVVPATARAFPGTAPGAAQSIALDAAHGEYEGVLVAVRGAAARDVTVSWKAGSDTLITGNATLAEVKSVRVTHPSTDAGTKAGWYPDPLVPRAFGAAVTMPARTAALYVLVHVPYGTEPGAYSGTLRVQNGAESVELPVRLRVWDFGWTRLSTHTAFSLSTNAIKESLRGSVGFTGARKQRLYTG